MSERESVESLRNQYRAERARYQEWRAVHMPNTPFREDKFREQIALHHGGRVNGISVTKTPETPQEWVAATKSYVDFMLTLNEGDEEEDYYEGYLGTGMSEAAYYTAAGSAEFL
jgi:hypothetical protein